MNVYKLLKIFTRIRSKRVKLLGLWSMHTMRRRYIGVFLDPVMACNLQCRMCYMSDPARKQPGFSAAPKMDAAELDYVARTFFRHAVKLQIGCATEPTLWRRLPEIVAKGKEMGVPHISITTNGQLLTTDFLTELLEAGLDEVTLSVHGLDKPTYEDMMRGARFERFRALLADLREAKRSYQHLQVRINYVMNADNTLALEHLYDVLDGLHVDVLQLRPVQKLGETSYHNFSLDLIEENYDRLILPIRERCQREGTLLICPTKENLHEVATADDPFVDYVERLTYYYVSPGGCNKEGFRWLSDDFAGYHRRQHTGRSLLRSVLRLPASASGRHSSKKLNYKVD